MAQVPGTDGREPGAGRRRARPTQVGRAQHAVHIGSDRPTWSLHVPPGDPRGHGWTIITGWRGARTIGRLAPSHFDTWPKCPPAALTKSTKKNRPGKKRLIASRSLGTSQAVIYVTYRSENDSESGTGRRLTNVEITPEMIDVGHHQFCTFDSRIEEIEDVVKRIYCEMRLLEPRGRFRIL